VQSKSARVSATDGPCDATVAAMTGALQ